MPTKIRIEKGPGLTEFMLKGGVMTQESVTIRFGFHKQQDNKLIEAVVFLTHIGEDRVYVHDNNDFTFIAYRMGDLGDNNRNDRYYFVGKYSTTSRTGICEMMSEREFFTSPRIAQILLPVAARNFLKTQSVKRGSKIIKVCVKCSSAVHQDKFESVIAFCCEDAIPSALGNADLVITDDPTDELFNSLKPGAHVALYGASIKSNPKESETELRMEKPELELLVLIERLSRGEPANKAGTRYVS